MNVVFCLSRASGPACGQAFSPLGFLALGEDMPFSISEKKNSRKFPKVKANSIWSVPVVTK